MASVDEENGLEEGRSSSDDFGDVDDDEGDDILDIGQEVPAHIPDIVLNNLNQFLDRKGNVSIPNEHNYENSTLLFLDVSGFTNLTEQYANEAHFGVDQLIRTLNSYFNKLVYEILAHKGDIYKFAGDAILALWGNDEHGPQNALKCALHLQRKCGVYSTDIGVTLYLKVAVSYGSVRALYVGTEDFKHYLLTGDCVKNVNACEQLCKPEDIIITKTIYEKVQAEEFHCEFVPVSEELDPKQEHFLVKYSRSRQPSFEDDSGPEEHVDSTAFVDTRMDKTNQEITNDSTPNDKKELSEDDLPADQLNQKLELLMKSFLLRGVHQRIEQNQSLYYLSELRHATTSFINLDIAEDETARENIPKLIHEIFLIVNELTMKMGGVLTKALMFDKGWSFLCVFGLPGYKQGDDTANALKSAQMIHSAIRKQCEFVRKCSIGVATGLTYCGVVGHKARCEYTVIGRKVNMAARLMCNYLNVVSCDQETYSNSRLNRQCFQALPSKPLKGLNNVGIIWHYDSNQHHDTCEESEAQKIQTTAQENDLRHEHYPLLGRRVELMIVASQIMLLDEPATSANPRRDLAAIIFEGDDKMGRSRLLQFIADSLETSTNSNHICSLSHYNETYIPVDTTSNGDTTLLPTFPDDDKRESSLNTYGTDCTTMKKSSIRIINYRCQFEQRFNEFGLLRFLLKQLLQFHSEEQSAHEREQCLLHLFDINQSHDLYLRKNLFLLNDLLDTRFRRSHPEEDSANENTLSKSFETNINEMIVHLLNKLIDSPDNIAELYNQSSTENLPNKPICSYIQVGALRSSAASSTSALAPPTVSKILFIIDDIHFGDESSLKHLLTFGAHSKCLLILSMKPPRSNNNYDRSNSHILQSISTDSRVYLRRLPGLELRYLATLGCQILSVHRMPSKLIKVLNENCSGIPGFCEQILLDLLSKERIHIVENDQSHDDDDELVEGDADKLVTTLSTNNGLFRTFFSRQKQEISAEQRQKERAFARVCLLKYPCNNDFSADCQQNFQNYIMCRIDRLSEGESLLIKIAAVIGSTFSRSFLWHLVDPGSKKLINIQSCILEMMQRSVIECAHSQQQPTKTRSIKCYCLQNPAGFPSQCRLMAFTHASIREGICNSLTDGLKRLLTKNAVEYLEKHCHVACLTCRESKHDNPYLVREQSELAQMIKNRQQHAFADIVKIAGLKEIDNTIKELTRSSTSPIRARKNSPKMLEETLSIPGTKRMDRTPYVDEAYRRGFSLFAVPERASPEPSQSETVDESDQEDSSEKNSPEPHRKNSSDPNLTLISLYSRDTLPHMQVNVQRSPSSVDPIRSSQIFPLFRLPERTQSESVVSDNNTLKPVRGTMKNEPQKEFKPAVEVSKKDKIERSSRFLTFFRFLFCQFVPMDPSTTVTHVDGVAPAEEISSPPPSPPPSSDAPPPSPPPSSDSPPPPPSASASDSTAQPDEPPAKRTSHWDKVRRAILPAYGKILNELPNEDELRQKSLFSPELMESFSTDIQALLKQRSLTRTFEILYEQSLVFHLFQSHVRHNNLIHYVHQAKQNPPDAPDLNEFISNLAFYSDLRACECPDYVMTVYMRLVEYNTNLYDIFEKTIEDKHDEVCLKQFDRIMYYRTEICQLLLRCQSNQHLLVEVDNGRRFLEKLQKDIRDQENPLFQYQILITKYTYNFFEAKFLQHSRALNESKDLCEQCLTELNQAYEEKVWEKLVLDADVISLSEKKHEEVRKDSQSKEASTDCSSTSSGATNLEQYILANGKYRLEYLLCQYHLLRYDLSRHDATESVNKLLELEYHTFPLSFSLSCTVQLVEYFYCQRDLPQCSTLIDKLIQFWWGFTDARQRLEFAKLKCLSLIIELKQGSLEAAINSGYFARRLLSGYHENTFLIESCIHLTLALTGEMRASNIELILQHLEYLSEQTVHCYAKLWYYVLALDVAMELGYKLIPISTDLLNNIAKYRKKLHAKSHETSLLLVYSDSVLAQIYARLGQLDDSKVHFHLALHQIKYDQMFLSHVNLCFKRSLLKLVETQLLHWFHTKEDEENITIDHFLLNQFTEKDFIAWNKTRFLIYQAYYDRLVNEYRRQADFTIDNELNWEVCLREAEKDAIKLDSEWIKRLRKAWAHPVSEQLSLQGKGLRASESSRRTTILPKQNHRFARLSFSHAKAETTQPTSAEPAPKKESAEITVDEYSHQKFVNWRTLQNNQNISKFHLYILPVKV